MATLLAGQPLLLRVQLPFQLGQPAVAQLGGAVQVVVALGLLGLLADLFDLPAQFLDLAQRLPPPCGPSGRTRIPRSWGFSATGRDLLEQSGTQRLGPLERAAAVHPGAVAGEAARDDGGQHLVDVTG